MASATTSPDASHFAQQHTTPEETPPVDGEKEKGNSSRTTQAKEALVKGAVYVRKNSGKALGTGASFVKDNVWDLNKAGRRQGSFRDLKQRAVDAGKGLGIGATPVEGVKHLAREAGEGAMNAASAAREQAEKVTKEAIHAAMAHVRHGAHAAAEAAAEKKEQVTATIESKKRKAKEVAKRAGRKALKKAKRKLSKKHTGQDNTVSQKHGTHALMPTQDLRNIFDDLCVTVEFT